MTQATAITMMASAKINLTLHICGRRADNFHLLDSLVVFAGVGDRITVSPSDSIRLSIAGPFGGALTSEPDNLVVRAARLLAETYKIEQGADIHLEKNLPVASGIGGGSADAAATLRACGQLWDVDPARITDADIAAKLGADVPVCLRGLPAFMSGIGEVLIPAPPLPAAWLVLVNPGEPLSTKTVFTALRGRFSPAMPRDGWTGLKDAGALGRVLNLYRNDLMAPALESLPVISDVLKALEDEKGCLLARLSGSGPTCFGLFGDASTAQAAATRIGARRPRWWTAAAPMLAAPAGIPS